MKPLPHVYEARLSGGRTGYATLSAPGLPRLSTAPPPDYDGPGDAWSPEHLLLASVEACFLFTLRAVAAASQLGFTNLELASAGTVDRADGVVRFTEIVLRPRLTVPDGTNRDRAIRVMEKAERACLVSQSLRTSIRLESEVIVESQLEARADAGAYVMTGGST
jgi:peroxiredoxin-like protein